MSEPARLLVTNRTPVTARNLRESIADEDRARGALHSVELRIAELRDQIARLTWESDRLADKVLEAAASRQKISIALEEG